MTAPAGPSRVDRTAIATQLSACRADLHHLLDTAGPRRLDAPSNGTAWTNEQLLFHMVFGFLVVRRLLPLVRIVSALPPGFGRGFAAVLDSGRVPFHWVNYLGSCAGALVFNRARMGWLCDRTIQALIRSLDRVPEARLQRMMPFPTSWDPYFTAHMTVADVYEYPVLHYAHHRVQLTLVG
jgi:hypothetical protein